MQRSQQASGKIFENNYVQRAPWNGILSRQMSSSNSRSVHNRLASQYLHRLLDWRKWNEPKLAEESRVLPSVISAHLSGQRPIRPRHLAAYLRVLNRQERSALLDAWLRDNVRSEVVANLLDGTRTDSMRSVPENRARMLDWWAMAIARDFKLAKIFRRFCTKAAFNSPLELVSLVSTTAIQFQGWLLEKACSLLPRIKHAAVALVTFVLGLCQQGEVTQQAEQSGELPGKAIANSPLATSFLAPALAETTNLNLDVRDLSPPVDSRQNRVTSRAIVKSGPRWQEPQYQVAPALRIQGTIDHEWRRLVTARKSVHSAFDRIRDAHPRQLKQAYRKQRQN
jgi:hypothetical protein